MSNKQVANAFLWWYDIEESKQNILMNQQQLKPPIKGDDVIKLRRLYGGELGKKEETTPKALLSENLQDVYEMFECREFTSLRDLCELKNIIHQAKQLERKIEEQVKWTPIDKDNLPEGEVLAICLSEKSRFYKVKFYGKLSRYYQQFICSSLHSSMINATHYLNINNLGIEKEND